MKKIALVRPYFKELVTQQSYPLGLGYLAAVLRKQGYWVRIYDLNIIHLKNERFIRLIKKIRVDYIGVSGLTYDFLGMIDLCTKIKKDADLKQIPLIIGGVHVSSLPKFSLQKTMADIAVIGEGEKTIVDLIYTLEHQQDLTKVNGIAYIEKNQYTETAPRELIKNLDDIPYPAWDLIHPELYISPHGMFYKKKPIFPIFSTRGCPFQCEYCASKNFWKQRIRFRSPKNVVDEIEFLIKSYNAKEIQIWDDNFTLNRKYVLEFCYEIRKRNIKMFFSCPNGVKIDTLDYRLLQIMKSAGFYSIHFPVESGSQKILNNVKKQLNLSVVPDIIAAAKKLRILTRGFFILGLPTETIQTVYQTIEFSLKLKLDMANYFIFLPIPGSTFFYRWIKSKNLEDINWDFDFFSNPQDFSDFNSIPTKTLLKLQKLVFIKFFFLRPWKLLNYISKYKISQYPIILNRILYVFFKKK
jgi:radical SAM superfamily enzyme YgiQ (UPF0313 family)